MVGGGRVGKGFVVLRLWYSLHLFSTLYSHSITEAFWFEKAFSKYLVQPLKQHCQVYH